MTAFAATTAKLVGPANARVTTLERSAVKIADFEQVLLAAGLGGVLPATVAQPANWTASWHEEPLTVLPDGSIIVVGSDANGQSHALKTTLLSGRGIALKSFTGGFSTIDDHNAQSVSPPSISAAMIAMCGHGTSYIGGGTKNEIRIARAASGLFADLPVDRANQIVIALPVGEAPNYLQWLHIRTGALAGRICLFYNDDTSTSWRCYFSDDNGATWTRGRKLFAGSGVNQVYMRLDTDGIFTGSVFATSGTFLPFYAFNNVTNAEFTAGTILRYSYINLANGQVISPANGNAAASGASIFDQTSQDTAITTLASTGENALRNVRVLPGPNAPRAQRIHMVKNGTVYLTDFAFPTAGADVRHIVRKNGVDYDLGSAGRCFSPEVNHYNPDIQPGLELGIVGDRIYRCYNDGTAYNSGAKLDRIDYPNGIQNGGAVVTRMLTAGTGGIAADEAIMRYYPIRGSGTLSVGGIVGVASVGKYTTYQDWTQNRYVPVVYQP